jgi:3-oxoacyl-[acyl-carrier-protein] synthase III
MNPIFTQHFSHALGTVRTTLADSTRSGRTFTEYGPLYDAGFRHHHMAARQESAYDLARRAVEPLRPMLSTCGAIVYATCLPCNATVGSEEAFQQEGDVKHLMDFPASRLQREFQLDDAIIIGIGQQACTSMIGSIRLAAMMLSADPQIGAVLCVSADRFPPGARYEQTYNLISDGAGACIVSYVPTGYRFIAAHHISNGALVQATDDEVVGSFFSYMHKLTIELLAKVDLKPADINWVVSQNTNPKVWRIMSSLLGISEGKIFAPTMDEVGHVISADNVINLGALEASGQLRQGDRILLPMAGFGLNWQALLLERI